MNKPLRIFCQVFIALVALSFVSIWYLYQPLVSGTIYLKNAPGVASISYEEDTGIAHIRGASLESAIYAQGFSHAQTRLWQMYKNRAIFNGELAEVFGADALPIDKFSRTLGYRRIATQTWDMMSESQKKIFEAYSSGVNDFIKSVSLSDGSARLLPPEFYIFGIANKIKPWHPIDSLANILLINFSLTWDWAQDFTREVNKMENEELRLLAEELTPFTSNYLVNMVTVLDDNDVKRMGKWSEKTLGERYLENLAHLREAEPKRDQNEIAEAFKEITQIPVLSKDAADQMHSNNWVIHGNYTATGKPMLANDPHLGTSLPSFWTLNELIWDDKFLIGASAPGMPLIGIGRSKNVSFGQTSPLCDNSDLWQETLSDDQTKYFVDGQWKDLKIVHEKIIVKGSEPLDYEVKFTHRGPLMEPELIYGAGVLFGGTMPEAKYKHHYSHMWGGMFPGESLINIILDVASGMGVKELMDKIEKNGKSGHKSLPMNLVLADNGGDIGYMMLVPFPNRKDKTPFIGNRVLDGTTTAYDWDGLVPISQLPKTFNPERGYVATANQRQMPDHTADDIGATSMSTGRSQRIDEMIRGFISENHKITVEDMQSIQQDDTDVIARDFTPKMIKIARKVSTELTGSQRVAMESIFKYLEGWNGQFSEDSIAATCYSYTMLYFYKSLMHRQYPGDESRRLKVIDNYNFVDFVERLFLDVESNPSESRFNAICMDANSYKGKNNCAYNLAVAFGQAHDFLNENLSKSSDNWIWMNVHRNIYPNLPWSKTPLRYVFHREVPTFGSTNTPHVSKVSYRAASQTMRFESSHVAGYKQIIAHADTAHAGVNLYSIDTGTSGNIFAGNYFNMNKNHLEGNLNKMLIGPQIQEAKFTTLIIRPAVQQQGESEKGSDL